MSIRAVRAIALWFLVSALPASAQFSITPLSTFGSGGWLAPNGYNGSLAGLIYQLESKDSLTQPNWVPILPVVPGTGTLILLHDTNALTAATRFYRVNCF